MIFQEIGTLKNLSPKIYSPIWSRRKVIFFRYLYLVWKLEINWFHYANCGYKAGPPFKAGKTTNAGATKDEDTNARITKDTNAETTKDEGTNAGATKDEDTNEEDAKDTNAGVKLPSWITSS